MNKPTSREKALYRYHTALERGDFATVAAILRQAEQDATLARMLLELNAALAAEADATSAPQAVARSTNGQRHPGAPAKEELPMTAYESTAAGRTLFPARNTHQKADRRPRFRPALTLIAALVVVALAGAALLSSGLPAGINGTSANPPGGAGPDGLPGAAQQVVTASPTFTPTVTWTATPSPIASPTFTPTPFPATVAGPQADPLILTATAIVDQATHMAGGGLMPTVVPPMPSQGTMAIGGGGGGSFGGGISTSGGIATMDGGAVTMFSGFPIGNTASFGLAAGGVGFVQFTADTAGALTITTTSLDFTPSLLVFSLDDPDLAIQRNTDDQTPPTVSVTVSPGDRVLVLVYAADRDATGQYLLNAHMAE